MAPAATEPLLTRLSNAWLFRSQPDAMTQEFVRRYTQAFRLAPNSFAARSYDATILVIAAVRKVGADRALVRDYLSTSHGAGVARTLTRTGSRP
jgi:ABC-type branched-subunit amino acid transport system substrate-binding protein